MAILKNWEFWALWLVLGVGAFFAGLSERSPESPDPAWISWAVWIGLVVMVIGVVGILGCLLAGGGFPAWPEKTIAFLLSVRVTFGDNAPSWLTKIANQDGENLASTLHQFDERRQDGNVSFNLDHERQPSIVFHFRYVNASVYTLQLKDIEGPLQVEGELLSGRFVFQPMEVHHSHQLFLTLRFVIDTDASVNSMKALLDGDKKVHFNLDAVRVSLQAKEVPSVSATLRFLQQWWKPPRESETL